MGSPRDLIAHLAGAATTGNATPVEMLRAVPPEGRTARSLAEAMELPRQTVYRAMDPLERQHLLDPSPYRRTGTGEVVLHVLETATERPPVDREALALLADTEHRERTLAALGDGPVQKRTLASGEDRPSRPTVYRTVRRFKRRGWATEPTDADGVSRTPAGDEVAETFRSLVTDIGRALERTPTLRWLDATVTDVPLAGLAAADQYCHTPTNPDPDLDRTAQLVAAEPASFRGALSVVPRSRAEQLDRLVRSGAETELVSTERVLRDLPTEGVYAARMRRVIEAPNFSLRVVPGSAELPVGLALFGDRTAALRPPALSRALGEEPVGSVIGSDDALVGWAESLYAWLRWGARPLDTVVLDGLKRRLEGSGSVTSGDAGAD